MQRFLATSIDRAERLDRWNDKLSELFAGLAADPEEPDSFDGSLHWNRVGSITGAKAFAKRCRMHHPAGLATGKESSFILKLQLRGRALAEHVGEEALLHPGDLILFDTDKDHRLTLLDDSEMLALCVPKSMALPRLSALEPLAGMRLTGDDPAVRLCSDYARSLWQLSIDAGEKGLPDGSTDILCSLLGMCAPKTVRDSARVHRADWSMIQNYLRDRILEPELSIARVSADLGVTSRRLQQIFAAKGTTPARHVLEERLKEARRRLSDPGSRDRSITDIAFDVGFGDMTYFGRAFRARYGSSPAAFRRSLRSN